MNDHGITPEMLAAESPTLTADKVPQDVIDRVVETVRELCGWHVWPEREETLTVDTTGDPTIFLPTLRLVDVLAVTADGETVAPSEYGWSSDGWIERSRTARPPSWPAGPRAVSATVRHGLESCPALVAVCAQMVSRSLFSGQDGYTVGSISVGTRSGITPQSTEWRIIDHYRLEPTP